MTVTKIWAAVVVVAIAVGAAGIATFHPSPFNQPSVAQGQEQPHKVQAPAPPPAAARPQRPLHVAAATSPSRHDMQAAAPVVRRRAPLLRGAVRQIGGREPAMRVLSPGAWVNTSTLDVVLRMTSPMASARLQPQIELRRAGQAFTGRPNVSGATVSFDGSPVRGVVHLRGLRDGAAYHWRVRVRDTLGGYSAWVDPFKSRTLLRVHLGAPARPVAALVTPAQPGNWVSTRSIALRWTPPADRSGIRGYAYTLSRSPSAAPAMRLRTGSTGVRVTARGNGPWYFTVRALNFAHSWGPPARVAVYVDTAVPRLHDLLVPQHPVNMRRVHQLARMTLTADARVVVDILSRSGGVIRSIPTHVHSAGYPLAINWDGTDTHGHVVANGSYMLRIKAVTPAGLTWQVARRLDLVNNPPAFTGYGLSQTGSYNPYNNDIDGPEVITAALSQPAAVHIEAVHGDRVLRTWDVPAVTAGAVITATWDGATSAGAATPGGLYTFRATAVDAAGDRTELKLGWVVLDHRRIVVSLNAQRLWALDGDRVLLTTLVTSGGPELPTPTGEFQIIDRESPFTFHSPFPPDSPYWYPDSPTNFALLFQWNGYFIHDAPWRTYYGPGSNIVDGKPGSNTTGTHGCVNVPYYPMAWLFNWATMYTPVDVVQDFTPPAGQ